MSVCKLIGPAQRKVRKDLLQTGWNARTYLFEGTRRSSSTSDMMGLVQQCAGNYLIKHF